MKEDDDARVLDEVERRYKRVSRDSGSNIHSTDVQSLRLN